MRKKVEQMLMNPFSTKLNSFKYLDKLPLVEGSRYRIKGSLLKFKSIDSLLKFYRFDPTKIYTIEIINNNYLRDNKEEDVKGLTMLEAYRNLVKYAKYRYVYIFNNEIAMEWLTPTDDPIDCNVDFTFLYGDNLFSPEDKVTSTITGESYRVSFSRNYKYGDDIDMYTRDNLVNLRMFIDTGNIDLCYLLVKDDTIFENNIPESRLRRINNEY